MYVIVCALAYLCAGVFFFMSVSMCWCRHMCVVYVLQSHLLHQKPSFPICLSTWITCIFTHTHTHTLIPVHTRTHTYKHIHTYKHMLTHTHRHAHPLFICVAVPQATKHVLPHFCLSMCIICTCTHIHTNTQTRAHTHTYTQTHTYTHMSHTHTHTNEHTHRIILSSHEHR